EVEDHQAQLLKLLPEFIRRLQVARVHLLKATALLLHQAEVLEAAVVQEAAHVALVQVVRPVVEEDNSLHTSYFIPFYHKCFTID
ncbi:MAG: hypothetical protein KKB74_10285, partial [Bacteroidetes bacterium]|nr:hypothetical protein [Bacteroidota bacterium]